MADRTGSQSRGMGGGLPPTSSAYLSKARAALAGAELELANALYNNVLNRAYYACYQAAVAALVAEGVVPEPENYWPHDMVQARFAELCIDELGRYPRSMRATLKATFDERLKADYEPDLIDAATASEGVRRAQAFVGVVASCLGSR